MSFTRKLAGAVLAAGLLLPAHGAEEKKDEKKPEPPKVTMTIPFALVTGTTNPFTIRGLSLTNASEVRPLSASSVPTVEIKKRGKAIIPDKGDPKKLGDTQLEVQLVLPDDFPAGDLSFIVVTPAGDTGTNWLRIVPQELFREEKEPNPGFRKANNVAVPQIIRGVIQDANDVDVFRFRGEAGQRIVLETRSARYGSALDALLNLYNAQGQILATSDDAGSLDARVAQVLPRSGDYFVAINDAHDRGGATYTYLMEIRAEPATP